MKSGNGLGETFSLQDQSYQAQVSRVAQSQSPNSRGAPMATFQSNVSANTTVANQHFYMAERLKKKGGNVRPVSIDENQVLTSTNDSRVQEVLPNETRQNNKSVQMRSTMYANPYLTQLQNKQIPKQSNKMQDNNMMIMT